MAGRDVTEGVGDRVCFAFPAYASADTSWSVVDGDAVRAASAAATEAKAGAETSACALAFAFRLKLVRPLAGIDAPLKDASPFAFPLGFPVTFAFAWPLTI